MRSRLRKRLQRVASGLMLVATLAFLHQASITAVAQAAASTGSMPQAAVNVSGALHLHGHLAKLVHIHGGDNMLGHVHHPHHHDDDVDETGASQFWSLGGATAVMPALDMFAVSFDLQAVVRGQPRECLSGIEPDGLQRPPSTPGIA